MDRWQRTGQLSQAVSSAVSEMDGDDLRENDNVGQ
jgi:hypothetical protein